MNDISKRSSSSLDTFLRALARLELLAFLGPLALARLELLAFLGPLALAFFGLAFLGPPAIFPKMAFRRPGGISVFYSRVKKNERYFLYFLRRILFPSSMVNSFTWVSSVKLISFLFSSRPVVFIALFGRTLNCLTLSGEAS